jgi:hypothetical protein
MHRLGVEMTRRLFLAIDDDNTGAVEAHVRDGTPAGNGGVYAVTMCGACAGVPSSDSAFE